MKNRFLVQAYTDKSTWVLIASNVIFMFTALKEGWSLPTIMFAYWGQSVIIGIFSFSRIATLKKFSTKGFKINNRYVDPSNYIKWYTAIFFAVHYGIFHLVYLVFILGAAKGRIDAHFVLSMILVFFANHLFSFIYNKKRDSEKVPNIGKVMFYPYARIIPMHFTIIFGGMLFGNLHILFFLILKTGADVVMHLQEHKA